MGNNDGPPYSVRGFYAVESRFWSIYKWTGNSRIDGSFINGLGNS